MLPVLFLQQAVWIDVSCSDGFTSPVMLHGSKHEWALMYHYTLLPWAQGPAFLWGTSEPFSLVKAWQVCKAGFSRGVRTSSPEGSWSGCQTQEPWKACSGLGAHVWKCDICVCVSWWDSRPVLAGLGVNSSPKHPAAEGLIWLPAFPFSDSCTEQCVSLALVSVPLRPGRGQLEAQGETRIEFS